MDKSNLGESGSVLNVFSERLSHLVEESCMSCEEISKVVGTYPSTLRNYIHGKNKPSMDIVVRLADYFGVPVDYLVGRTELYIQDYRKRFMELRRDSFEGCLRKRGRLNVGIGVETPYPYNLLDDIVNGRWEEELMPDQEAGLQKALSGLADRERTMLKAYYEDGLSLESVGALSGVTKERARQILAKAVRKMRHPVRFNVIKYGLEEVERRSKVKQEERALDDLEQELIRRRIMLEDAMPPETFKDKQERRKIEKRSIPIIEMDLSVRSYNCLKRAGVDTLGDLMDIADNDGIYGFLKIRNFGRRSLAEVFRKMEELTGTDWRARAEET